METIARFIVKHSRKIIAITAIINLTAAASIIRAKIDVSVESLFNMSGRYTKALSKITKKYGGTDTVQIVLSLNSSAKSSSLLTEKNILTLWEYQKKITAIKGVVSAISFIPQTIPATYPPLKTNKKLLKKYHERIAKLVLKKGKQQ